MAEEILILAVVLVFAVDAFLYYRWKALKEEEAEETRVGGTEGGLLALHATVSARAPTASGTLATQTAGLAEEAKRIASELRAIAENDLVQLHQKLYAAESKIAAA